MSTTVYDLRKNGTKVRVLHWRYQKSNLFTTHNLQALPDIQDKSKISPKGGKTRVEVTFPNSNTVVGESVCSKSDSFDRKMGIKIALGRALANVTNN